VRREALEEAGIAIALDGVIRVEHTPRADGHTRCRVLFTAHPVDDTPPKSTPDEESLGAAWITLDAMHEYDLRGEEIRALCEYVASGGPVFPLFVVVPEYAPFDLWLTRRRPARSP
jgi:8-oxo-dGTP pyrophosphatase MutT (NUDIX family)